MRAIHLIILYVLIYIFYQQHIQIKPQIDILMRWVLRTSCSIYIVSKMQIIENNNRFVKKNLF